MTIKIEKDVPIPKFGRPYKYPFPEMEVGDSFVIKDGTAAPAARAWAARQNNGWKFTERSISATERRLWRIK